MRESLFAVISESMSAVTSENLLAVTSESETRSVPVTNDEVDDVESQTDTEEQEDEIPHDPRVVLETDPFLMAITAGDYGSVQRLLKEGQDMYVKLEQARDYSWMRRDLNGMFLAIDHNHLNIVELLLDEGYDIETQNDEYQCTTPLIYAVIKGNYEIVKYLLSRGAHVNAIDFLSLSSLAIACRLKYISIADLLLENGADPNNFTAIIEKENKRSKAQFNGKDAASTENEYDETALKKSINYINTATYEAAANGLTDLVGRLIEHGADLSTRSVSGPQGSTPLSGAAHYGYLDTVQLLLQHGSDVNNNLTIKQCKQDNEVGNGGKQSRRGCRCCNNARSFVNCSPLHLAVKNGHIPVINYLLQHGADPNIASDNNTTPLMTAAKMKSLEIVQILLHHGADVLMPDDFNFTAIGHACESFAEGDLELVKSLLSKCPPTYMFPCSTILQGPCGRISQSSIKERKELIQLLLDRVHAVQDGPFCPIATACKSIDDAHASFRHAARARRTSAFGGPEEIQGTSVGSEDAEEDQEMAEANLAISATLEVVEMLLKQGANPNYLSGYKLSSCLHYCYYHTDLSIIHTLIEAGADPYIKDRDGETVLDLIEMNTNSAYMKTRAEILRLYSNKVNFDRRKAFLAVLVENGYILSAANPPLNGTQDSVLQNLDIVKLIFAYL